jgi:hypothetical protein
MDIEELARRHESLAMSVELMQIETRAFLQKVDVYIAQTDRRIERLDRLIAGNDARLRQIEANHTLLIQLVDGQQTRLARLEDRQ